MASATGCRPAPGGRSCALAASRAATGSPPDRGRTTILDAGETEERAAARIDRLRTRRAFAALRRDGTRHRCGPLTVVAAPAPSDSAAVAYAVGRSVGPAVVRNRVRRRLRTAVRELRPAAGSYLVIAGAGASTATYSELHDALSAALAASSDR